jgi:hypothetical protein
MLWIRVFSSPSTSLHGRRAFSSLFCCVQCPANCVSLKYFLWYTILLPFYLPYSSLLASPRLGLTAATLWILSQVSRIPASNMSMRHFFLNAILFLFIIHKISIQVNHKPSLLIYSQTKPVNFHLPSENYTSHLIILPHFFLISVSLKLN